MLWKAYVWDAATHGVDVVIVLAQPWTVRLLVALLLPAVASCASVASAVVAECAAAALQGAAEVCCDAAIGAICEDSDDGVDDDSDDAVAEVPPPPPREPLPDVPPCASRELPGGVWRLDCVDGTIAEALVGPGVDEGPSGRVVGLADVERLAGVRGLPGSLRIGGAALLRLELPSLHHVDGDLVIEETTQLATLRLPALTRVQGALRVFRNRALRSDPVPALRGASVVDVAFNDVLPGPVVDRLLALAPPPPAPVDNAD